MRPKRLTACGRGLTGEEVKRGLRLFSARFSVPPASGKVRTGGGSKTEEGGQQRTTRCEAAGQVLARGYTQVACHFAVQGSGRARVIFARRQPAASLPAL